MKLTEFVRLLLGATALLAMPICLSPHRENPVIRTNSFRPVNQAIPKLRHASFKL